jgi:hypothetical protein
MNISKYYKQQKILYVTTTDNDLKIKAEIIRVQERIGTAQNDEQIEFGKCLLSYFI